MKIALAQLNYKVGDIEANYHKIKRQIKQSSQEGVDLIVFSELSLCGYPPQDLLEHKGFIEKCSFYTQKIAEDCQDIAALVGAPVVNDSNRGKHLYNAAFFMYEGVIQQVIKKTLLPTYDIFDEYRYFESNEQFETINYKGKHLAVTICEDLWDQQPVDNPLFKPNLYKKTPMEELIRKKPDCIINLAASPFAFRRVELKKEVFCNNAKRFSLPVLYVNQVGANTELIFEGNSLVVNAEGQVVEQLPFFSEGCEIIDIDEIERKQEIPSLAFDPVELIYRALVMGVRDFFVKMGFSKATLGLSGGIDSAVTLVIAAEALGAENIWVLLLPSKYSSSHSIDDSVLLAEKLGVKYDILSIEDAVSSYETILKPIFEGTEEDVAEENIQSRIRGTLLMALSNKFGHILLNTSNKSESAVGYGTLYGDMAGGLSVIGDVYKSDLYRLSHYMNRHEEIIPENIINKAPSAELKPDQKDSDSLPDYDLLDAILFQYIEMQKSSDEIVKQGYKQSMVERVIKMVNQNEFKRYQSPPMLRISSKAFGMGRRMPLVASY